MRSLAFPSRREADSLRDTATPQNLKRPPCWTRAHAPPPSTCPTTLPRTGCRSPPTGPSRRRRGCSPAPRTCITSPSTAARSSTPPPACGATNAGHGRTQISAAIAKQAETLDYAPPFQFGIPQAFELASRIADLAPAGLDHVFFCNSGSEAADTALKIALAYHQIQRPGHPHPPDRPRARLSRRRLRRHLGGRHRQ